MPLLRASSSTAGKQAHLELESQYVHARSAALAAFGDDLFDEQPPNRQVDRTDDY